MKVGVVPINSGVTSAAEVIAIAEKAEEVPALAVVFLNALGREQVDEVDVDFHGGLSL